MTRTAPWLTLSLVVGLAAPALAQPAPATPSRLEGSVGSGQSLRRGAEGPAVRELQALLRDQGAQVAVDGDFGPATEAAVRAFQRSQGLAADGVVGPRTLAKLRGAGTLGANDVISGRPTPDAGARPSSSALPPRPGPRTPLAQAYQDALRRAEAGRAAGRRTLVIAFEGLWSYNSGYAARLYRYVDALRAGQRASEPIWTPMVFVGKGLLAPAAARDARRADLVVLPETSENPQEDSVGEVVARAYHQVHGASLNLVVVGHSFGGYAGLRLAAKLRPHGVTIDGFLAIDARTYTQNYRHFVKPGNVTRLYCYYQKSPVFPGYEIQGADLNLRLRGENHGGIPGAAEVRERYRQLVGAPRP